MKDGCLCLLFAVPRASPCSKRFATIPSPESYPQRVCSCLSPFLSISRSFSITTLSRSRAPISCLILSFVFVPRLSPPFSLSLFLSLSSLFHEPIPILRSFFCICLSSITISFRLYLYTLLYSLSLYMYLRSLSFFLYLSLPLSLFLSLSLSDV